MVGVGESETAGPTYFRSGNTSTRTIPSRKFLASFAFETAPFDKILPVVAR